MRPSLQTITERRSRRPRRGRRKARTRDVEQAPPLVTSSQPLSGSSTVSPTPAAEPSTQDLTVRKVRQAMGGPIDQASYACQCGYLFVATVTTTVTCPNCGATQAW